MLNFARFLRLLLENVLQLRSGDDVAAFARRRLASVRRDDRLSRFREDERLILAALSNERPGSLLLQPRLHA